MFVGVRETRAIARLGLLRIARLQRNVVAADRHQEHIAKIAVARAGKMRMREAENRRVFVAISGRPLIALLEGPNLRVGRQLHHAERRGRTRKRMSLRASTDQRVDQLEGIGRLGEEPSWPQSAP